MEVIATHRVLANGTRVEEFPQMKKEASMKEISLVDSPPVAKWLKEEQEFLTREERFYKMVAHVLEKIEQESREEYMEEEKGLWPEMSMLDMKKYLKPDVNTTGVSDHSSVFILESVNTKIGRILHSADVYDLCDLAVCSDSQVENIVKKSKNVSKSEIECAVQDAKIVMNILKNEKLAKGNWTNNTLSRMTGALHLKESTDKIANFMLNINPKGLVDVIVRAQDSREDDIDSFYNM